MAWENQAAKWLANKKLDTALKQELLIGQTNKELMEAGFYKKLSFDTAGLRGELGFDTNRMGNIYTVRKTALGLAAYITSCGEVAMRRGVVIAYDSRHYSPEFEIKVAKVLGHNGVRDFLFEEIQPTLLPSFAVRELNAFTEDVITASHKPSEYNGLKVYREDGGQVISEAATAITAHMESIDDIFSVAVAEETALLENGLLTYLDDEMGERYLGYLDGLILTEEVNKDISIVYTQLHGADGKLVLGGLEKAGYHNVTVVTEQAVPDADFSTVKYPNPEESQVFEMALTYGHKVKADLLLATDRMGTAVRDESDGHAFLTGNQIGTLMLNALLEDKSNGKGIPKNGIVLKNIM